MRKYDESWFSFKDIEEACGAIAPYIRETPLEEAFYLGGGSGLYGLSGSRYFYKLESFQRAKSFKIRGAMNKLLSLTREERERGIATISSGNHGSSVSYAASLLGIKNAVVIVPKTAPKSKVERIKYFGAEVLQLGENYDEAHAEGMKYIEERGMVYIDAYYDDPKIYAGQGTIGVELLRQDPDIDTVVCPIGGGGLITGIATAVKTLKPEIRVFGVQTEACPAMAASLRENVFYDEYPIKGDTVCDALVGGVGALSYARLGELIEEVIVVREATIRKAVAFMAREEKFIVEGGSATTIAAIMEQPEKVGGKNIALILSGGNIDGELLSEIMG